ncbi:nucleotide exchange factor GrpE [bacterium]|nr:nucleotide exchange factor GrpE [Actinomycetota bacterium]MBE33478.1 nucleotide exchange factor GrpE [bacterium]|tara:strand:+ start:15503 stop:16165 length:663 start_codon:yes stop_codon:yes gene_type:complete
MSVTQENNDLKEESVQNDSVDVEPVDLDALKQKSTKKPKKNAKKNSSNFNKEVIQLQEQLEAVIKERDDLAAQSQADQDAAKAGKEEALRYMAELENFKRRKNQEVDNFKKFAAENVVKEFLPVCDNFALATSHANSSDQSSEEVIKGFILIQQQLDSALAKLDVVSIETKDKSFDPNFHQAISQQAQEGVEPNMIVQEVQKGYILNGKVIRPSMVIVST